MRRSPGTFKLSMVFTEDYPNKAPQIKFITKMFHPNIYADGAICLDILQNQWSPIYDISAILTSIQSLLTDPNPNSPANSEASRLYVENKGEYNRRVKAIVEESWKAWFTLYQVLLLFLGWFSGREILIGWEYIRKICLAMKVLVSAAA